MDPRENLANQIHLAREITGKADAEAHDDLLADIAASENLAEMGAELAELVIAMHEWRASGGFDPYAGAKVTCNNTAPFNGSACGD